MRNISFSLTTPQFLARTKTVTRRLNWLDVKVGDRLMGCEKCMGRKPGEPLVRLGAIEVVSVWREPLKRITQADVIAEGFPNHTPASFVRFFCASHDKCKPATTVTRIEYRYIDNPVKKQIPPKKTGAAMNRGSSKQDYQTPVCFMAPVIGRFGPINFDLAAHAENTQHPNFFSLRDDSLRQEWHKIPGLLWLNPPFDNIAPWANKCALEAARGARILFLTPASVGSNWFASHVHRHSLVLGLNGRIPFDPANPTWGYPKDCILSCYGFGVGFDTWTWRREET